MQTLALTSQWSNLDVLPLAASLFLLLVLVWIGQRVVKAAVRNGIREALQQEEQSSDWSPTVRQTLER